MNTCDFDAALLDQFLDGALTPEQAAEVTAHLDKCPECCAYVDDLLMMQAHFPNAEEVELPDNFLESVMKNVAKMPQDQPRKQPWGKMVAAAACLALIVLVQQAGVPMGKSGQDKSLAAPAAAPMGIAAASMLDTPAEYAENGAMEESDRSDVWMISVTEAELGEVSEDLKPQPSDEAPGYTCYLLEREDALTAVLVERGILSELPEHGTMIRLEVWNEST